MPCPQVSAQQRVQLAAKRNQLQGYRFLPDTCFKAQQGLLAQRCAALPDITVPANSSTNEQHSIPSHCVCVCAALDWQQVQAQADVHKLPPPQA